MEKIIAYAGNDVHQEFIKVAVYRGNESTTSIEKKEKRDKLRSLSFFRSFRIGDVPDL